MKKETEKIFNGLLWTKRPNLQRKKYLQCGVALYPECVGLVVSVMGMILTPVYFD